MPKIIQQYIYLLSVYVIRTYNIYRTHFSKGLKKAEIVKQGQFLDSDFAFDFSNEYGGQSFFDVLSEDDYQYAN